MERVLVLCDVIDSNCAGLDSGANANSSTVNSLIEDTDSNDLSDHKEAIGVDGSVDDIPSSEAVNAAELAKITLPDDHDDWRDEVSKPIIFVRCKKLRGELVKARFGSGSRGKCILCNGIWMTPTEFEAHCGRSASKDWKRSIKFKDQTLQTLIEEEYLQIHAQSCSCAVCLDSSISAGPVRLNTPSRRKKQKKLIKPCLNKESLQRHIKKQLILNQGKVLLTQLPTTSGVRIKTEGSSLQGTNCHMAGHTPDLNDMPLEKAWEHMNMMFSSLEKTVADIAAVLTKLQERCQKELSQLRHERQQATMAQSSEVIFHLRNGAVSQSVTCGTSASIPDLVFVNGDSGKAKQPLNQDPCLPHCPASYEFSLHCLASMYKL